LTLRCDPLVNPDGVQPGVVAGQRPVAGTAVPANSTVLVLIRRESPGVAVPDVIGLPAAGACAPIQRAGLVCGPGHSPGADPAGSGRSRRQHGQSALRTRRPPDARAADCGWLRGLARTRRRARRARASTASPSTPAPTGAAGRGEAARRSADGPRGRDPGVVM